MNTFWIKEKSKKDESWMTINERIGENINERIDEYINKSMNISMKG